MGLVVPPGSSVDDVWERSLRGDSGIGVLRRFDPQGHRCTAAGEVEAFTLATCLKNPKNEKFMGVSVRYAVRAAKMAVAASGLDLAALDPFRTAVYTASGQTGLESSEFFGAFEIAWTGDQAVDFANLGGRAARALDRYWSLRTLSNGGLGLISAELGAKGPSHNFVQGDTASAMAISAAAGDLTANRCDVAVVGGYESLLNVSDYLAYEDAGLLSGADPPDAYRPFDRRRDGLVLAEGAAFLVLERCEDAQRRGAPIVGELLGVGCAMDTTWRMDANESERTLRAAVRDAAGGSSVDFVVAHGIGTPAGDRAEARALESVVGPGVPVTAMKSLTGYLGAATGAVELALALQAARARLVPPVARLEELDEDCHLSLVTSAARALQSERPSVLCVSWSWFGQCSALAARAWIS
jgi:3-oxoacyl-[acyl-carrier-protein] synthase II